MTFREKCANVSWWNVFWDVVFYGGWLVSAFFIIWGKDPVTKQTAVWYMLYMMFEISRRSDKENAEKRFQSMQEEINFLRRESGK